jgi:protein gp37
MSLLSKIEWTDATWNPVRGCTKVSPGCKHCYAERFAERFRGVKGHPFEQGFDLRLVPNKLGEPLRWSEPRMIFVNSMSDLFHEDIPDAFVDRVFAVMALAPRHTFQVLTKRADRMREYTSARNGYCCGVWHAAHKIKPPPPPQHWYHAGRRFDWPLPNVWLGVSVENQHFADERVPLLLRTPAAVRFISAEPLLGPVDLREFIPDPLDGTVHLAGDDLPPLDWVIVGGESGPHARPFDLAWARTIVAQCEAAGVPVFVKQLGANPREEHPHGKHRIDGMIPDGYQLLLRSTKGGDPSEWPSDLRVREYPVTKE